MRFIKVCSIHDNPTVYDLLQTVVCCEYKFFSTSKLIPQFDLLCFSCAEVVCLTTMNMQNIYISDVLKKFAAQLICQQNTWSDNNNRSIHSIIERRQCVLNHAHRLATTCRDDDSAFLIALHCLTCSLLMWTE